MKPIVAAFDLFGRPAYVPGYGLLVTLGFAVGVTLACREAHRRGLPLTAILDVSFWILIAGLVGARLMFVVLRADEFIRLCQGRLDTVRTSRMVLSDCTAVVRFWEGGLVFYGGAIASVLTLTYLARRLALPLPDLADTFAPGLAVGHGLGRLGCLLAGCCFGRPAQELPLGIAFPAGSVAHNEWLGHGWLDASATTTPPLLPTQPLEALALFATAAWLFRRARKPHAPGTQALSYALAYTAIRFTGELLRGDPGRGFLFKLPPENPWLLSTSQLVSLAIGAIVWRQLQRQRCPQ